jgi:hypothetical protein
MSYHRRRITGARTALAWGVFGFCCVQLALDVGVVARHPELQDPEYGARLALLRERLAESPDRPLLLLLGSSRTVGSFVPEKLPPLRAASGEPPLVFNFSHLGAGPGMNLLEMRRLLRNGIRPSWLVLEIMPPQLGDEGQSILLSTAGARDLPITRRYRHPFKVYGNFVRTQLVPCHRYRRFLAYHAVPDWIPDAEWEQDQVHLAPLGGEGSQPPAPDAAETRRRTDLARQGYFPPLRDLHVVDLSDRATRELLDLCRRRGIAVALVLTPEGSAFRSWYAPESRRRVDAYCDALSRDYGVPLIDAREWLEDGDFTDSHHVTPRGAEVFTLRLGREVLRPLAEGRPMGTAPLQLASMPQEP